MLDHAVRVSLTGFDLSTHHSYEKRGFFVGAESQAPVVRAFAMDGFFSEGLSLGRISHLTDRYALVRNMRDQMARIMHQF